MRAVVVIYGLPGVGKSAVCHGIRKRLGLPWLQVDDIWKRLFDPPSFSQAESNQVFAQLRNEIKLMLSKGETCMLVEGVFASRNRLSILRQMCREFDVEFWPVLLRAAKDVLRDRILNHSTSEAIGIAPVSSAKLNWLSDQVDSDCEAVLTLRTDRLNLAASTQIITSLLLPVTGEI